MVVLPPLYTRDAFYMDSDTITIRPWLPYANITYSLFAGINCINGRHGMRDPAWVIATYTRDGFRIEVNNIGSRQWLPYADFSFGSAVAGINSLNGHYGINSSFFPLATNYAMYRESGLDNRSRQFLPYGYILNGIGYSGICRIYCAGWKDSTDNITATYLY